MHLHRIDLWIVALAHHARVCCLLFGCSSFLLPPHAPQHNALESLSVLSSCPSLRTLDASHNRLETLLDFSPPRQLRSIDYSHNNLKELTGSGGGNILSNKYLESANLAVNRLTCLANITQLPRLKWIDVSRNELNSLEDFFTVPNNSQGSDPSSPGPLLLPLLEYLDASGNFLKGSLSLVIQGQGSNSGPSSLGSLRTLILDKNQLTDLKGVQDAFPSLTKLRLKSNNLESLEDVAPFLSTLASLVELDLRGCPLEQQENYRMNLLHLLPRLEVLDGVEVSAEEIVAAHNAHGADRAMRGAIRSLYLPHGDHTAPHHGPKKIVGLSQSPSKSQPLNVSSPQAINIPCTILPSESYWTLLSERGFQSEWDEFLRVAKERIPAVTDAEQAGLDEEGNPQPSTGTATFDLDLSGIPLGEVGLWSLSNLLPSRGAQSIRSLNLSQTVHPRRWTSLIGESYGTRLLFNSLQSLKGLQSLSLKGCHLGREGGTLLGEYLSTPTAKGSLRALHLARNLLGENQVAHAPSSNDGGDGLGGPELKVVHSCPGLKAILSALSFDSQLDLLDLSHNSIDEQGARALGRWLDPLRGSSLEEGQEQEMEQGAVAPLEDNQYDQYDQYDPQQQQQQQLDPSFDVDGVDDDPNDVEATAYDNSEDRPFDDIDPYIQQQQQQEAQSQAQAQTQEVPQHPPQPRLTGAGTTLNPRSPLLRSLILDANPLGDTGLKLLGESLKHNGSLTALSLKGQHASGAGGVGFGPKGFTLFAESVSKYNRTIRKLDLSGNRGLFEEEEEELILGEEDEEGDESELDANDQNKKKQRSTPSSSPVSNALASLLFQPSGGPPLTCLNLEDTGLTDTVFTRGALLQQALEKNDSLTTLRLGYNPHIGEEGRSIFFNSLAKGASNRGRNGKGSTLKSLHLDGWTLGQKSCLKLSELLSRSHTLEEVHLTDPLKQTRGSFEEEVSQWGGGGSSFDLESDSYFEAWSDGLSQKGRDDSEPAGELSELVLSTLSGSIMIARSRSLKSISLTGIGGHLSTLLSNIFGPLVVAPAVKSSPSQTPNQGPQPSPLLDPSDLTPLQQQFSPPSMGLLSSVNLSGNHWSPKHFDLLSNGLVGSQQLTPNLETLCLRNLVLEGITSPEELLDLFARFTRALVKSSVQTLDLSGTPIGNGGLEGIGLGILSNNTGVNDGGYDDASASFGGSSGNLTTLILSNCSIDSFELLGTDMHGSPASNFLLSLGLEQNNIQSLNLSKNDLSSADLLALFDSGLDSNWNLRRLDLSENVLKTSSSNERETMHVFTRSIAHAVSHGLLSLDLPSVKSSETSLSLREGLIDAIASGWASGVSQATSFLAEHGRTPESVLHTLSLDIGALLSGVILSWAQKQKLLEALRSLSQRSTRECKEIESFRLVKILAGGEVLKLNTQQAVSFFLFPHKHKVAAFSIVPCRDHSLVPLFVCVLSVCVVIFSLSVIFRTCVESI